MVFTQTQNRTTSSGEAYIWARNISHKTISRVSLPGLDAIAIRVLDVNSDSLTASERMKLCEWKHTEDKDGIARPCQSSAQYLLDLTMPKLVQELALISKDLRRRGEENKSVRVFHFAAEFARKSLHVRLASAILGQADCAVCLNHLERHFVNVLTAGGWQGQSCCGSATITASIQDLAKRVYAGFLY
jgi:hypothetical protein